MKFQVVLGFSLLAFVASQASAQTAETRVAAATAAVTAEPATSAQKPQLPAATAAVEPGTQARPQARPARRPVTRQEQPQQQQPTWQERMRAMWGVDNPQASPRQADPRQADPRQSGLRPSAAQQPQYPAAPGYSARPNNRLMFGMFYTKIPRQTVAFPGNYAPGTIIVRHREKRLYFVLGNGQAIQYGVAVGREGAAWSGTSTVSNKREWPSWTPTPAILARQPNLPRHMEGGPNNPMGARALYHNPMGARALYLGDTLYRIHGTNEPWMIGEEVSSGCIRMTNEDVIDLYERTRMGATVIVQR
ncbi:MAG: L,D-transpeptidase family protein [Pseudorhodoplanes sp.]